MKKASMTAWAIKNKKGKIVVATGYTEGDLPEIYIRKKDAEEQIFEENYPDCVAVKVKIEEG